ncbi:MAG: hypothetical protein GY835_05625 [bacterium]|nr:hypothetical protein [bacterium]
MILDHVIPKVELESERGGPFRAAARKGLLAFIMGKELDDNPYAGWHPVTLAFNDSWRFGWHFGRKHNMSLNEI